MVVAPDPKARNRYRLCMLWNTTKKRPLWLNIKSEKMQSFCCQLHWGSFVDHCFKCGGLGHFMAECQQIPVGEGPNTPCCDMVMLNQVLQEHERNKSQEVNIGKENTIVPSEQKGKRVVEEVLEESETEERPWTKVGANGRFSRYHKENIPL